MSSKTNGVKHVKTAPYHPASNGLVEQAVQTFKSGMKKLREAEEVEQGQKVTNQLEG